VQPQCSLCLCVYTILWTNHHRDTENTEVAQEEIILFLRQNSGFPARSGINCRPQNLADYGCRMEDEKHLRQIPRYKPEAWRDDDASGDARVSSRRPPVNPTMREQCRLLDLLGRINYRILSGNKVYIEVDGVVYKTLYGGYWRSVFTGIEHYLLRCEQVSDGAWSADAKTSVDLPIAYSDNGWTARGHSLSFILNRDRKENQPTFIRRFRRFRKLMTSRTKVSTIAI
jgi:hypothetical protein